MIKSLNEASKSLRLLIASITFLASAFGKDWISLMISFVVASVITLYNIVRFRQTSNLFTTFFQDIAKRNKIDTQFISAVRNFVLNNKFALEKAADELIRDSEFKQIMIKSGEIASTEERDELVHKTKMIIKNKLNNNKFSGKDKDNAEAALLERPEIPCD